MHVHVTRSKNRNGSYSYRFCRTPQALGDYRNDEIREEKVISLTFSRPMPKDQRAQAKERLLKIRENK